jgi:hypothetical protein
LEALSKHILNELVDNLDDEAIDSPSVSVKTSARQEEILDVDALSEEDAEAELLKALNHIQGMKG